MAQNMGENRERGIFKTSIIGIITNVFLGLVKAFVGILAGSIALATDALNNLSDAVSTPLIKSLQQPKKSIISWSST